MSEVKFIDSESAETLSGVGFIASVTKFIVFKIDEIVSEIKGFDLKSGEMVFKTIEMILGGSEKVSRADEIKKLRESFKL